jgi:dynein intermediate chain 4, axonemal
VAEEDAKDILARQERDRTMSSSALLRSLTVVERAIKQNSHQMQQLKYRHLLNGKEVDIVANRKMLVWEDNDEIEEVAKPVKVKSGSDAVPDGSQGKRQQSTGDRGVHTSKKAAPVELLWTFACDLTSQRTVHVMCWCRGRKGASRHDHVTRDLLAVGYSAPKGPKPSTDSKLDAGASHSSPGGLVLLWSLRNPQHPERVLHLPSGVTALDFSSHHPNLLAVGLMDGSISIFDVHKEEHYNEPILDTSNLAGRHSDPVWQLKWVDKGMEQREGLVSISTDGRIMEWSTSKGLSATPLMVLKRVGNLQGKISNQANGLSLDFVHGDASIYIASTEDGFIHKCSVSYNEHHLETYTGHTAPVYRVATSPFLSNAFLSCSGDWTVKLWNLKETKPVYSFHYSDVSSVVNDVVWSPHVPTVFASVTGDGRLMVWDLAQSTIDPVVVHAWEIPSAAPLVPEDDSTTPGGASVNHMTRGLMSTPTTMEGQRGTGASPSTGGPTLDTSAATPESAPASAGAPATDSGDTNSAPEDPEALLDIIGSLGVSRPEFTTVIFYKETPSVVLVGDSHGSVSCFKLVDVIDVEESGRMSPEEKAKALRRAMYPESTL